MIVVTSTVERIEISCAIDERSKVEELVDKDFCLVFGGPTRIMDTKKSGKNVKGRRLVYERTITSSTVTR